MSTETIQDLFQRGLEDISCAEHELLDALEKLKDLTESYDLESIPTQRSGLR